MMNKSVIKFSGLSITMWLSLIGTQLTDFSLGIWVYQKEESAALYGVIGFAIVFPQLAFSPILGKYVDRFDHRRLMMLGHSGSALCTVLIITLYTLDMLTAVTVALVAAMAAVCNCLVALTFNASIIYQVKRQHLARVQGIVQAGLGVAQITVPILSAFLLSSVGLTGIFVIDVLSFSAVLTFLVFVKLNRDSGDIEAEKEDKTMSLNRALLLFARKDISLLILYGVVLSFAMGVVQVLIPPLMLDIADVTDLGVLVSVAGTGMLAGSILMAVRGANADIFNSLLWSSVFIGFLLFSSPLIFATEQGFYVMMMGAFIMMCCFALASGYSQTLWVQTIPESMQGRVFGFRNVLLGVSYSVALLISGFFVDYAIAPLVKLIESYSSIVMVSTIPAYFTCIGGLVIIFSIYFWQRITFASEVKNIQIESQ